MSIFHDLGDGLTDAGVGLLDVEHLGDGGGDVGDVDLTTRAAVLYLPTVEQQGDMGIVGVPFAVGGADGRRPLAKLIPACLEHQQQIA